MMLALEPETWAKVLAFGLFLLLAGVASSAHVALSGINRNRIKNLIEGGLSRAQAILRVLDEPTSIFATILVLGTAGTSGSIICAMLLALEPAVTWPWGALALLIGSIVAVLLVQVIARTVAVAKPEGTALLLARPLELARAVLTPVLVPLQVLERRGLNLMGFSRPNEPGAAEEELRLLVESVEDNSALEEDEREMIHGIFEMSERPAREVMRPRIDIISESREATIGQVLDRIVESGFSRIPIYENSIDEVVGIVYAKDILRHLREGTLDDPAAPIARAAHFIPETKKVDELLQELQKRRVHMAIVVDEYGGTAGLLTIEDLLEEIVGEIQDEYDLHEEQLLEQVSEREAVVDARTPLRDLNDVFDLHLNVEDFDTLGGLVYHELGKVPVEGDEVRVNGCQVTVLSTQGRRIKKLRVTLVEEPLA
jgi:putative hemolysin